MCYLWVFRLKTIWILDNGSSFYLVSDIICIERSLKVRRNGRRGSTAITKHGILLIFTSVMVKMAKMRLPNIHYAKTWRGRSFDMYS